jgi:hypothetical protein
MSKYIFTRMIKAIKNMFCVDKNSLQFHTRNVQDVYSNKNLIKLNNSTS